MSLTRRRYTGGPPPVCIKGPLAGPPPPLGYPATKMSVFIHWTDYPTWPPWDSIELFQIPPGAPAVLYYGESAPGASRFRVWFTKVGESDLWNIVINSYRPDRMTLAAGAQNVYIDPRGRFTTPILHYWGDFHFYEVYFQITT